jgi:hypothetical protein
MFEPCCILRRGCAPLSVEHRHNSSSSIDIRPLFEASGSVEELDSWQADTPSAQSHIVIEETGDWLNQNLLTILRRVFHASRNNVNLWLLGSSISYMISVYSYFSWYSLWTLMDETDPHSQVRNLFALSQHHRTAPSLAAGIKSRILHI